VPFAVAVARVGPTRSPFARLTPRRSLPHHPASAMSRYTARMDRRTFLSTMGVAVPLAADAQQAGKVWRIALIYVAPRKDQNALFQGLRELGYVEGEKPCRRSRYSEGRAERFPEFAAELVRLNVDVIIVETTPAALAVKRATKTIPVVFPTAIDPMGAGPGRQSCPTRRQHHRAYHGGSRRGRQTATTSSGKWFHAFLRWQFSGMRPIPRTCALGRRRKRQLGRS
jgi:hypothetical protein